jgi:hypothetical protein
MPINFVGGTTATGAGVATLSATYSPSLSNPVILFIGFNGAVTSLVVKDNFTNLLTAGPSFTGGGINCYSFYYPSSPSGVTGYTATWTTSRSVAITLEEYSGNTGGINPSLSGNVNNATSTTASLTVILDDPNDFIVVGMTSGNALTSSVGNQRQITNSGTIKQLLADNTATSPTSITVSATLSSGAWAAVGIELRLMPSGLFTAPAITADFQWGGGDGW